MHINNRVSETWKTETPEKKNVTRDSGTVSKQLTLLFPGYPCAQSLYFHRIQ